MTGVGTARPGAPRFGVRGRQHGASGGGWDMWGYGRARDGGGGPGGGARAAATGRVRADVRGVLAGGGGQG
ncbi:hypothetical protein GCM10009864_79530 [Streptomyces lunalinharesii]|uniref:Uncharacterized protein n=1 Tax=Streptomyces lunalinharesii TaxID=333384 RepID=A0ABN3T5D4_9ACTN